MSILRGLMGRLRFWLGFHDFSIIFFSARSGRLLSRAHVEAVLALSSFFLFFMKNRKHREKEKSRA